jgi:hypothetical protein
MIEVIVDNTYKKTSPMRSFKRFKKDECEHTPSVIEVTYTVSYETFLGIDRKLVDYCQSINLIE